MEFEWDARKAAQNVKKHGVHFADSVAAFEDAAALTIRDSFTDEEERWITLGKDSLGALLVVIYTWRGENIRVISARRATTRESSQYGGHYEK